MASHSNASSDAVTSTKNTGRKRTGYAKSKNGCFTCKIRRIKCDEARPCCVRCSSTGRRCDGYPESDASKDWVVIKQQPRSELRVNPAVLKFRIAYDEQIYSFFRQHVATNLSGYYNVDVWNRLILQAVATEPVVLSAALAVGSLVQANLQSLETHSAKPDLRYALEQYTKAVRGLYGLLIRTDRESIQTALVCSLLCICFEIFVWKYETALLHLNHSLEILKRYSLGLAGNRKLSAGFDDDIVQAFVRLDIEACWWGGGRSPSLTILEPFNQLDFQTVPEARHSLHEMMNYICRAISTNNLSDAGFDPAHAATDVEHILDGLDRWYFRLEQVIEQLNPSADLREANVLLIQHCQARLVIKVSLSSGTSPHDGFNADLEELLSRARYLLDPDSEMTRHDHREAISIDVGIAQPLAWVSTQAPEPSTRSEAIRLLKTMPQCEGMWKDYMSWRVEIGMRKMEEAGWISAPLRQWSTAEFGLVNGALTDGSGSNTPSSLPENG